MKARLHEIGELRNRPYVFRDRSHAGKTLAVMLSPDYGRVKNLLVLAIPSGGVPVAVELSGSLDCPMDLLIVRKLQIPGNPEAGFGAMTMDGAVFMNEPLLAELRLTRDQIEEQKRKVKGELENRNDLFRKGRHFPLLDNRTVILVDDGLASGYTMTASIHEVKSKNAFRIIVAVPTAPLSSIHGIGDLVDDIYCPNVREGPFFAVAGAYEDWYDLDHGEVMRLLQGQGSREAKSPRETGKEG